MVTVTPQSAIIRHVISLRGPRLGLVIVAFAVLAAGCARLQNPEGWASPVIEDDTALIFQDRERLSSVLIEDGRIVLTKWTFPDDNIEAQKDIDLRAVYRAPEFDGEFYYVAGFTGVIAALTPDGDIQWIRDEGDKIDGDVVSGVVLAGNSLFLGTSNGELIQLSKADGRILGTPWQLDDAIWAEPVIIGGSVYAATMNGTLYGFDIESGDALWPPVKSPGAIPDLMSVNDELLFVPSFDSNVRFFDPDTGQQVGEKFITNDWVWSRAALSGDMVYFGDFSGVVYALNITSGNTTWQYDARTKIKAAPVIVGDALVVVTEKAVVHFIALADGVVRNTVPLQNAGTVRATPTVAGDSAYIIGTKGRLFRAEPESLSVRAVPRPGE